MLIVLCFVYQYFFHIAKKKMVAFFKLNKKTHNSQKNANYI